MMLLIFVFIGEFVIFERHIICTWDSDYSKVVIQNHLTSNNNVLVII